MENFECIIRRNKFIAAIISSIQMNVNDFIQNLANGENYETTIYQLSINLFDEGKSLKEAIDIILQRRVIATLKPSKISKDHNTITTSRIHQKVMSRLRLQSTYFKLTNWQKKRIQSKIDALVKTRLYNYPEIIQFVLGIIQHTMIKTQQEVYKIKTSKNEINISNNEQMLLPEFKNYLDPKIVTSGIRVESSHLN